MTCIVGIEFDGKVYLGGDSIAVADSSPVTVTDPKVFLVDDVVIGFCGSWRIGNLLRHDFHPPTQAPDRSDEAYLIIDVVDALRELMAKRGCLSKEHDCEVMPDDTGLLLGYKGKVCYVDNDFQVGHVANGYYALGSGQDSALGSLHATSELSETMNDPVRRINMALRASVQWNVNVRPPFTVVCLEPTITKAPRKRKTTRA